MYHQLKAFVSLYVQLTDADWQEICSLFKPIDVFKHEFLIRRGQTSNYLYFINSGLLRMFYLKDGVEITRYFASEGEFATALSSYLTREPTLEHIEALENCSLLQLHFDGLQILYKNIPQWQTLMRNLLEEAYLGTAKRIEGLITQTAEERYIDFVKFNPDLLQRASQQHIATYLGVTPVSLSRIRGKLSRRQ